jgi:hypothetical protein
VRRHSRGKNFHPENTLMRPGTSVLGFLCYPGQLVLLLWKLQLQP